MDLLKNRFFRVYIVPGAVFQSVMVGGGYGTGREIVEYFTRFGLVGGLLGLGVAFAALALVLALTYEFARLHRVYDYRNFFKRLLGRFWLLFEILIILQFLLVLAVVASAAGNILRDTFDVPYVAGLVVMLTIVGVLTFFGRELIARVLTYWSFFLYAVFLAFFVSVLSQDGISIGGMFDNSEVLRGWWRSGFKYALYNLAGAPLLLYVARGFETRKEALRSGVVAAAIAIVPALMFQIAFFSAYPAILDQAIPVYWLMATGGMAVLLVVYSVMLFGTFIETGAGLLQGINERLDAYLIEKRGRGLSGGAHAAIAVSAIVSSSILSLWGISNLIASGYGTMAWGFFAVYVLPIVTIGFYRILWPSHPERGVAASPSS
jgi:uncharacterized membrane protein YkvI